MLILRPDSSGKTRLGMAIKGAAWGRGTVKIGESEPPPLTSSDGGHVTFTSHSEVTHQGPGGGRVTMGLMCGSIRTRLVLIKKTACVCVSHHRRSDRKQGQGGSDRFAEQEGEQCAGLLSCRR